MNRTSEDSWVNAREREYQRAEAEAETRADRIEAAYASQWEDNDAVAEALADIVAAPSQTIIILLRRARAQEQKGGSVSIYAALGRCLTLAVEARLYRQAELQAEREIALEKEANQQAREDYLREQREDER